MAANPTSSSFGSTPDVIFVFPQNEGASINVEKRKLMIISEVFRTQFSSDFDNSQPIEITDISFEIFQMIMKFIYTEEISVEESSYQELLYTATKYFIDPIISKVIEFSLTFITATNVVDVYEFFDKYEIQHINDHILKVCVENPVEVIAKLSGSNIHMKVLEKILKSPFMCCSEYDLYVAVQKMMDNACTGHAPDIAAEMRKKLGKLIYLIRFPTMSTKELARCGKPPSLLTTEQHSDLLLLIELGLYKESVRSFSRKLRLNLRQFVKCNYCSKNPGNHYNCSSCRSAKSFYLDRF